MRISVLGLGLMGSAIAFRLKEQGFNVLGWNRSEKSGDQFPTSTDLDSVLNTTDFLLLTLSDSDAIEETLFSAQADRLRGKTLLQMGTIGPDESREFEIKSRQAGAAWIEAPVLGSIPEARSGTLIVMAGGTPQVFESVRPILEALSTEYKLVGHVGQGAALKLAMNQMIGGLTATFASSLTLVRSEGIDVEDFMTLLRASALYAPTFDKKLEKMLEHNYANANFPLKHLVKDIRLFAAAAQASGMDTRIQQALTTLLEKGVDEGHGNDDYSSLAECLRNQA